MSYNKNSKFSKKSLSKKTQQVVTIDTFDIKKLVFEPIKVRVFKKGSMTHSPIKYDGGKFLFALPNCFCPGGVKPNLDKNNNDNVVGYSVFMSLCSANILLEEDTDKLSDEEYEKREEIIKLIDIFDQIRGKVYDFLLSKKQPFELDDTIKHTLNLGKKLYDASKKEGHTSYEKAWNFNIKKNNGNPDRTGVKPLFGRCIDVTKDKITNTYGPSMSAKLIWMSEKKSFTTKFENEFGESVAPLDITSSDENKINLNIEPIVHLENIYIGANPFSANVANVQIKLWSAVVSEPEGMEEPLSPSEALAALKNREDEEKDEEIKKKLEELEEEEEELEEEEEKVVAKKRPTPKIKE